MFVGTKYVLATIIVMKASQNIQELKRQAKALRLFSSATEQYASKKECIE